MKKILKNIIPIISIGIIIFSCNNKTVSVKDKNIIIEQEDSGNVIIEQEEPKNIITPDNLTTGDFQDNIAGYYADDEDVDNIIELKILQSKDNTYVYEFNTGSRILKGDIDFSSNEYDEKYVILKGIKWERWMFSNGEGDEEEWVGLPESELPDEIEAYIGENELIIQNYGNAMNNYLKLGDIAKKYIQLKKIESY